MSDERKVRYGRNPATRYTDEFRREAADHAVSSGEPVTERRRGLGLNSKTVNDWVVKRRRELGGGPDPKANDAGLSAGRTGGRRDNAVAESLFATPRNEMYYLRSWPNRGEARSAVVGYIEGCCNRARPHPAIGYQAPAGKMGAFFERGDPKREEVPLVA